jgi:hypothetical protein
LKTGRGKWFWLTFKSESRQDIKAPLTRVVNQIVPFIEADLANDDKIALTSEDLTALQKVNRLFAILDNSKDPAFKLVKSFRSALAATDNELRDKVQDGKFLEFALSVNAGNYP